MPRVSLVALVGAALFAQQSLVFDVASVKPAAPNQRGGLIRQMPGGQRYLANNLPLRVIMTVAYSVTDRQISGGPSWVGTDLWDIDAKSEKPASPEDLHAMLAHLIEERFHLKIRHEQRELPVYELIVDKGGAKLTEHDPTDLAHPPMTGTPEGLQGTNVTMNYLAFTLSRSLDRNVIDKTGLAARYDVNLEFARDIPNQPQTDGPSIFTAVREQLGLRLVPAKGPVDFLAIESAEKPADN